VRPGITGWTRTNGQQSISFSQRLEHDVRYVDHRSLCLDVFILSRTFIGVFWAKDVVVGQISDEADDVGLAR
jgi:sugar transferase EpsL